MTTMVTEVYDALISAGAPDEKARRAAEVLANYDKQFSDIRADLTGIRAELSIMNGQLGSMRALIGVNLTVALATLGTIAGLFIKLFH